jgi:hypothetical protein
MTAVRPTRFRRRGLFIVLSITVLVTVLAVPAGASAGNSGTVNFTSGPDWQVFTKDPGHAANGRGLGLGFLGSAQNVCLNAFSPSPCPDGALLYGWPGDGWFADLSAIPGAAWVWAPGVTDSTRPAELATYYFSKSFVLRGPPRVGTIHLSADDFAEVRVNGVAAGTVGSIADIGLSSLAQNELTVFDISSLLKPGRNVITVKGQNGPLSFPPFCDATCTYGQNPAGVVFGGSLSFL